MRKMAQRRQAHDVWRHILQRDDGLGWFLANTHIDFRMASLEQLNMTLYGGLINSETQPAFARDILYEDASPRDTSGLESGLKFDLQLDRAPVTGSEIHIDFIVTRTVSGDDFEVRFPVEPFSSDTWLGLDPNAFGGSSAHNMLVMPIAIPTNGGGAINTTSSNDNNVFVGRGTDNISMYVGSPQWSRYQDLTIRVREVLPNAGTSRAGGGTGTQQANVILRRQVITAPLDLTLNTGTDPSNFIPTEFAFGGVPKDRLAILRRGRGRCWPVHHWPVRYHAGYAWAKSGTSKTQTGTGTYPLKECRASCSRLNWAALLMSR